MRRMLLAAAVLLLAVLACAPAASAKGSGNIVPTGGGEGGEVASLTAKKCFKDPQSGTSGFESCGYPGEHTSGFEASGRKCSELTQKTESFGSTSEGQKLENKSIKGTVTVTSKNVTIKNMCIEAAGGPGIVVSGGSTGLTIENVTVHGEGPRYVEGTVEGTLYKAGMEHAIFMAEPGSSATMNKVYAYYCGECVFTGNGDNATLKRSFVYTNGMMEAPEPGNTHFEAYYTNGGGTIKIEESVLLEPVAQTADLFGDTGCSALKLQISKSFLAGGQWVLEPCSTSASVGSLEVNVTQTRFAKCTGTEEATGGGSYHVCAGNPELINAGAIGKSNFGGTFTGGYYPKYGSFGFTPVLRHEWGLGGVTWTGNFDDATGAEVTP